jgi:hypothetical protein
MMAEILLQGALAVLFALLSTTFYTYLLYPAYISPLSKIPSAHPLCVVTSLWIIWARFHDREIQVVDAAHKRLGSVVRLGPNEVSVNCIDGGIRTVHGGGFEKPKWYSFFVKYG